MFSTQLQLKFASISEAKIAAQSLCELLKGRISIFDFHGLHVTIGKEGELAVNVRFEEVAAMTRFEKELPALLEDIKQAFVFKQNRFSGVCVLSFEREACRHRLPSTPRPEVRTDKPQNCFPFFRVWKRRAMLAICDPIHQENNHARIDFRLDRGTC